jgi:hypothetical protein
MVPLAAEGLDQPVVRSMHRLLGKGYAGGGERQRLVSGLGADVFVVASSDVRLAGCIHPALSDKVISDGI